MRQIRLRKDNHRLIDNFKDIICTEKSVNLEINNNQLSIITSEHLTKRDMFKWLCIMFEMPKDNIKKIGMIPIRKKVLSRKKGRSFHYTGSNRSKLRGAKKWIVSLISIQGISKWFSNIKGEVTHDK